MKSTKEIFNETFGMYLPFLIHIVATAVILWVANTYFTRVRGELATDPERDQILFNIVIVCASVLWARMTYLHKKVMKKLEQIEKGKETEPAK